MKRLLIALGLLMQTLPGFAQDAAEPAAEGAGVIMAITQAGDDAESEVQDDPPALVILPASEVDLASLKWVSRPVIIFADTPADPRFREQMDLIAENPEELLARDVVVITDTDARELSPVRRKLRPRGFMLALIAKDGTVNLRKPFPWDVREISRAIDKMPMRQEELRRQ